MSPETPTCENVHKYINHTVFEGNPSLLSLAEELGYKNHCKVVSFAIARLCAREFGIPFQREAVSIPHIEVIRSWYMRDGISNIHVFPLFFDGNGKALYSDATYCQFDPDYYGRLARVEFVISQRSDLWKHLLTFNLEPISMQALQSESDSLREEVELAMQAAYSRGEPYSKEIENDISQLLERYTLALDT